MSLVTVYSFKWWSVGNHKLAHPRKAVANRIHKLQGAEIIQGSAQDIDELELSRDGYWYPEKAPLNSAIFRKGC